ncbi:patatin-like phospholipase family protein [Bradyrhizobium zhanjiangense]|uniref:patatin-like phospholipase family protein n=1 Tax=Bradyrhizobium zhanjiangense TaxID=1325107 RepID=UPI001FE09F25|nr:patatin-like phospholipase family protein [Bradyrhizobium zhanjiangense]
MFGTSTGAIIAALLAMGKTAVARAVSRVTPQSTSHVAHLIKTIGLGANGQMERTIP